MSHDPQSPTAALEELKKGDIVRVHTGEIGRVNSIDASMLQGINVTFARGCGGMYFRFEVERVTVVALETLSSKPLKDALEETGCRDQSDLVDMALVGSSLMEAIADLTKQEGPFKGWTPADNPVEIVIDLINHYEDALAAQPQQAVAGWKLVPVEPTPEIIKAVEFAIYRYSDCSGRDAERCAPYVYTAMLASAPAAPEGGELANSGTRASLAKTPYPKPPPSPIQAQGGETFAPDLQSPYIPLLFRFDDPPRLEYVKADVPTVARRVDDHMDVLLSMDRTEVVGFCFHLPAPKPKPEPPLTSAHPSSGKWNPEDAAWQMPAPDEGERWPWLPTLVEDDYGRQPLGVVFTEYQLREYAREYRRLNVGQRVKGDGSAKLEVTAASIAAIIFDCIDESVHSISGQEVSVVLGVNDAAQAIIKHMEGRRENKQ